MRRPERREWGIKSSYELWPNNYAAFRVLAITDFDVPHLNPVGPEFIHHSLTAPSYCTPRVQIWLSDDCSDPHAPLLICKFGPSPRKGDKPSYPIFETEFNWDGGDYRGQLCLGQMYPHSPEAMYFGNQSKLVHDAQIYDISSL